MFDDFKVMIVEDDSAVRYGATQALRLAGIDVEAHSSAEAAVSRLRRRYPGVVVSDVKLPGADGLRLLVDALAIDDGLPVILITGHGDISMAVKAMQLGAYDFLEKPVGADQLVNAVKRALEKRILTFELDDLRAKAAGAADIDAVLVGQSAPIRALRRAILNLSDSAPDVLVFGETGTGKELVADCLHRFSPSRGKRLVAINCGAIPESMFESEIFGHEAGAFTGAQKRRIGKIEHVAGGTLFLDEIESMPASLQVKLLRVLQDRRVERLGSNESVAVSMRVVAATKADLGRLSAEGGFRADLYYRLNVVTLRIPPLRERRDDIPLLFSHFMRQAGERYERNLPAIPEALRVELMSHEWPGNVRELRNVADRFVLGAFEGGLGGRRAEACDAPRSLPDVVEGFERGLILDALRGSKGDVALAGEALQIPKKTLYDKMRRFGLQPGADPDG
ncbi:MAG: sigma-54-dependent Fis family transcriptional regulator [Hyphomicrobiales bacterium]|nr:sigma-54 dependent transcriptional regulator [Hyphomicrobiales bacterium]MDE2016649.1 sigma-54-dependent Fis family transcriptional regulator [Hyphomicrobiales bacterium]